MFFTGVVPFGDSNRNPIDYQFNLMQTYPDTRIVYFPMSISYESPALLKKDKETLAQRDNVYMFLRDSHSLALARKHFPSVHAEYLPDVVWTFGGQERAQQAVVDVLILLDPEDSDLSVVKKALEKKNMKYEVWDISKPNMTLIAPYLDITQPEHRDLWPSFRTQMFNKLLSRGKVLITDHLQASSFGSLLRIPVVYLDDSTKTIATTRSDLNALYPSACNDYTLNIHAAKNEFDAVTRAVELVARVERESIYWAAYSNI